LNNVIVHLEAEIQQSAVNGPPARFVSVVDPGSACQSDPRFIITPIVYKACMRGFTDNKTSNINYNVVKIPAHVFKV
jgi:hypothetical protein